MRTRRVTVSAGTARELAEHAHGYTANAESQFSRRIANGGNPGRGITVRDLQEQLHVARVRASHHSDKAARRRAGEIARQLEQTLTQMGVSVAGQYKRPRHDAR